MENPNKIKPFLLTHLMKGVQKILRECSSRKTPLGEIGFWLPSFNRDLASTRTSFEIVALEVVGSTFRVDIVRGKPRTWFSSVFVAPTFGSVLETVTR